MSSIKINGKIISGDLDGGGDVCISCGILNVKSGKVFIDGNEIDLGTERVINIEVTGDIKNLIADSCDKITVNGNVEKVGTVSGDVKCGDVAGSVSTVSGDVRCGAIAGSVSTVSGDIN